MIRQWRKEMKYIFEKKYEKFSDASATIQKKERNIER
jgi:hypothetical protein